MNGSDVVIIGRGPAGLLMATLVAESGGRAMIVADGQGSLPLWGGQFDFRNYNDEGKPLKDPFAWWTRQPDHPGGTVSGAEWNGWWDHLRQLWHRIGIPTTPRVPRKNTVLLTPLGRLRPTFLAPQWHFTQSRAGPVTLVSIPGLMDFQATAAAQHYQVETGQAANVIEISTPPSWHARWQPLQWAWFLDSMEGRRWMLQELRRVRLEPDRPLLFPQMLGVEEVEPLMQSIAEVTGRFVGEVPLLPPAIGGLRIQRRWERWLKRQGVRFVSGRASEISRRNVLVLTNGRRIPAGHLVLATGGVLGGGIRVCPDGHLEHSVTGLEIGSVSTLSDLGRAGFAQTDNVPIAVGREVGDCDPDRHGDGGAVILWTVHQAYQALAHHDAQAEER
ncbi:FAD-binding protein [Sulfobacillus harzensis]|uniref:FAD-dependent oxidoreductase 2 FAD-binding domain-containing protein n=1 Tax=Sulfobacillus harzensis TaxID=2729629 RepID=A0A7Y0L2U1_9FIRM|nr:FAD-binding protein [Sulfobacillus harzensis]NMP22251.1 hypothetical protein [Sulfobacillus harzensis]